VANVIILLSRSFLQGGYVSYLTWPRPIWFNPSMDSQLQGARNMAKDIRHIRLEFEPVQHQRLRLAAATCGQSMTAFIRETVLDAVEEILTEWPAAQEEQKEGDDLSDDDGYEKGPSVGQKNDFFQDEAAEEERRCASEEQMTRQVETFFTRHGAKYAVPPKTPTGENPEGPIARMKKLIPPHVASAILSGI
jgi:hypothetical protein